MKRIRSTKTLIGGLCSLILVVLPSCMQVSAEEKTIQVRVIGDPDEGYGYELWQEGKRLIRQENLPALPGNVRCPDSTCARRIGQLAARRIEEGHFPPTLKREEVEALMQGP